MIEIRTSDVLQMLKDGMTREEIRLHYGLSKMDLKRLFQHPELKGRRTRPKPKFTILDDTSEDSEALSDTSENIETVEAIPLDDPTEFDNIEQTPDSSEASEEDDGDSDLSDAFANW